MSVKVHEVRIGENDFYIRRYDPFLGLELLGDLQKQFAGPLLGMMDGKPSGSPEETNKAMMEAFGKLSGSIDGKTLRNIAKRLVDKEFISVSLEGAPVRKLDEPALALSINSTADLLELCWEIVRFNFAEVVARFNTPFTPATPSQPASQ